MDARSFLQSLFGDCTTGHIEIVALCPSGRKLFPHIICRYPSADDVDNIDYDDLRRLNEQGYGIHFGVTVKAKPVLPEIRIGKYGDPYTHYRRSKAEDALTLTALWADVDDVDGLKRMSLPLGHEPSIVVKSGGGWHGYWLLKFPMRISDDNRSTIKRTLKGIAHECKGDKAVGELARIMRLPGYINTKPERNSPCEVVYASQKRYSFNELALAYALPERPPIERPVPPEACQLPRWVEAYLQSGAPHGERNNTLWRVAKKLQAAGYSEDQCYASAGQRALADGLPEHEVRATIRSAYSSPADLPELRPRIAYKLRGGDRIRRLT